MLKRGKKSTNWCGEAQFVLIKQVSFCEAWQFSMLQWKHIQMTFICWFQVCVSEAGTSKFHFQSLEICLVTAMQPKSLFIVSIALASSGMIRQLPCCSQLHKMTCTAIAGMRVCVCVGYKPEKQLTGEAKLWLLMQRTKLKCSELSGS